jgi:hypothetical protein
MDPTIPAFVWRTYGKNSKFIPVTGHGGSYGCETLRFPHFPDNRRADGGKTVRLTRRPFFTPQESSWYSFLLEAESTPEPYAAGRIRSTEKSSDLIGVGAIRRIIKTSVRTSSVQVGIRINCLADTSRNLYGLCHPARRQELSYNWYAFVQHRGARSWYFSGIP